MPVKQTRLRVNVLALDLLRLNSRRWGLLVLIDILSCLGRGRDQEDTAVVAAGARYCPVDLLWLSKNETKPSYY